MGVLGCSILVCIGADAQVSKYWVYFKGKEINPNRTYVSDVTLRNRTLLGIELFQYTDVPVSNCYIDSVRKYGARVVSPSRWLNAVTAYMDEEGVKKIRGLHFVSRVERATTKLVAAGLGGKTDFYSYAMEQIGAATLLERGLSGKGVYIGIIDGSFSTSNQSPGLMRLFANGRILGSRDFVSPATEDFFNVASSQKDYHGTAVWHLIGGYDTLKNLQYGLATDASYFLARTDDSFHENRVEEEHWVAALEWMDSTGVRLVNSSLGYATDFDDKQENYTPGHMDGKTTAITRAAQIATGEKGMILVIAAGNKGTDKSWQVVSAPADSEGVITVGATDIAWLKEDFSGIGPPLLPYVKPDVVCLAAGGGTSVSAPVITGLIACLLEADSTLSNTRIKEIVTRSAHLYPVPNNYLGYGVPDAQKALELIKHPGVKMHILEELRIHANKASIKLGDQEKNRVTVFHKSDSKTVKKQELVRVENNTLLVGRPGKTIVQSTVVLKDKLVEIVWE